MATPAHVMIAISGVFLVAWYGTKRFDRRRGAMPHLGMEDPLSDGYCHAATAALGAELREDPVHEFPGGTALCRDCGIAYPAGVLYCECGGETAEQEDPDEPLAGDETITAPPAELVCVHVADSAWKATLLKTLLATHDIPCATGGNAGSGPYQFSYGPLAEVRILVHLQHEREARALIGRCV